MLFFIDGKLVNKPEYEATLQQHMPFETISICYQGKTGYPDTGKNPLPRQQFMRGEDS